MAHGTPDWGLTAGVKTTYQLTDLAELAARLWAIDRFDRRGDVVYQTSFEYPGEPFLLSSTSGGVQDLSTGSVRSGAFAGRLGHDGSAGSGITLSVRVPYPVLSRFGFELSVDLDATLASLFLQVAAYDGAQETIFGVRWLASTQVLAVLQPDGSYANLATGLPLATTFAAWQTFKLVADFAAASWSRVILNERTYVPTTGPRLTVPAVTVPYLAFQVQANGDGLGVAGQAYIDDAILTQNEPA